MQNQSFGAHDIPDYENYDYKMEWIERSIENKAEKDLVLTLLRRHQDCLELGGGFGRVTSALELHFERIVMVDFSVSSLRTAQSKLRKANLLRSDIRTLPFNDDSFDCVLAVRVLHHVRDLEGLIGEIVRVCRDGADVVFAVPNSKFGLFKGIGHNRQAMVGRWNNISYVHLLEEYCHPDLALVEILGLGILDNRIGKRLGRFPTLSKIDSVTSRVWFLKPVLFLKYRIEKRNERKRFSLVDRD